MAVSLRIFLFNDKLLQEYLIVLIDVSGVAGKNLCNKVANNTSVI